MGLRLILGLMMSLLVLAPAASAKTVVVGHRASAGLAPENTLAAVKQSLKLGVDAIEIDVRRSKDGALVAFHDKQLQRTTNGQGNVDDMTLAQLNTLDAGSWFGPQYIDEWIPTLAEVMNTMAHSKTTLIINLRVPGLEAKVLEHIHTYHMQDRVILKSFNPEVLRKLAQLAPDIPRMYVIFGWYQRFNLLLSDEIRRQDPLTMPVQYLEVYHSFISPELLRQAHQHNMQLYVWGVHSRQAMAKMLTLGVDGIETDYPDRLFSLIDEFRLKQLTGFKH